MCSFKLKGKKYVCVSDRPGYWTDKPVNHEDKRSRNIGEIDENGKKAREMLLWCYRSNPPKAFLPKRKKNTFHVHVPSALLPLLLLLHISTSIVLKWHYANSNSSTHGHSKRIQAIKLSSDNNAKIILRKRRKRIRACGVGERGEKHINVFRSGLKVLYLIAIYTVSIETIRKAKRDGKWKAKSAKGSI